MENNTEKQNHTCKNGCCCSGFGGLAFCGVFFLFLGGYFLAESQGWISYDFPFWQILLIAFGGYLLVKSIARR